MRDLEIIWQRLVDREGKTCPRCRGTGREVRTAALLLRFLLAPRGIRVRLKERALSETEFDKAPLTSNLIRIHDIPLEDLLHGRTGESPCCSTCGDADCRTVEVAGRTYEVIPAGLIVRAGLAAARRLRKTSG